MIQTKSSVPAMQMLKSGDEHYTKRELIEPLLPLLYALRRRNSIEHAHDLTIWCPFDTREDVTCEIESKAHVIPRSLFVDVLEGAGYTVIATHIVTGHDFFMVEPEGHYDIIISNPPFKNKRQFFARALELDKPFALLSNLLWLNDTLPDDVFGTHEIELLIPTKRVEFDSAYTSSKKGKISFKAAYFCKRFLTHGSNLAYLDIR